MFTKMVLPRLGGAPAVWSVAMVFFQTALLAGYAYAHWLSRTLPVGLAAIVHLGVLAAVALMLPIGVAAGFDTPPSSGIGFWLIGLFAASIGLPFVALAASAPLLQNWFGASGHPQAKNPYVLYAASNLGSFAALLAYPLVIESTLTVRSQTLVWACGFALLAVMVAVAGVVVARASTTEVAAAPADAPPATWQDRLGWIALSAIPAGLVVAVTAYISTDVAAAPLLWVLPLALYLLTFVAVFRDRAWIRHEHVIFLVPFVIPGTCDQLAWRRPRILADDDCRQSPRLLHARVAVSWRALSAPPGPCAPDRVLSMDVVGRRAGRHLRRPDRAAHLRAALTSIRSSSLPRCSRFPEHSREAYASSLCARGRREPLLRSRSCSRCCSTSASAHQP